MKTMTLTLALSLILGGTALFAADAKSDDKDSKTATPQENTTVNANEVALIKTSAGDMTVEFWPDVAPKTVENFKTLAKKGFYDGTCFHRIMKDFMIQGGDPLSKDLSKEGQWGTGGPGYSVKAEFNSRKHTRGVLSMARSANPDSAGSQFFICHGDANFLDGKYTAFGKVIKGEDVLDKIANSPVTMSRSGERSKPIDRIEVKSITIVAPDAAK